MDKTLPFNKNRKSNAECCKYYKRKINLRQKKLLSMKKIDLENRNTNFKKGNSKYQIIIRKQQHF